MKNSKRRKKKGNKGGKSEENAFELTSAPLLRICRTCAVTFIEVIPTRCCEQPYVNNLQMALLLFFVTSRIDMHPCDNANIRNCCAA